MSASCLKIDSFGAVREMHFDDLEDLASHFHAVPTPLSNMAETSIFM